MIKIKPIYPILFSIFPILSLWSSNIEYIPFGDICPSLFYSLLISALIYSILVLISKNWDKAGLVVSLFLILFYSYGHVNNLVKNWGIWSNEYAPVRFLAPLWIVLFLIGSFVVTKKVKGTSKISEYFSWLSLALFIIPIFTIVKFYINPTTNEQISTEMAIDNREKIRWSGEGDPPDIYYIILDGYARSDILDELYEYDNSDFIDYLTDQGFYIANQSISNYNQTTLSLSSSLNLEYINYFKDVFGSNSNNRKPLSYLSRNSLVKRILESNDYQIVNIKSGLLNSSQNDPIIDVQLVEDTNIETKGNRPVNTFELFLLETTAFQGVIDALILGLNFDIDDQFFSDAAYHAHRERVLSAFEHLKTFDVNTGSFFVLVHIVAPHPPFVFDSIGGEVDFEHAFTHNDGNLEPGERDNYIQGYRNQLIYVNSKIKESLNSILQNSDRKPIIILQADHGPGAYLYWDSIEQSKVKERSSILNAYYFPDEKYDDLYQSISPVNTFRLLFNTYFNGNFEILDDKSYFSSWDHPFDFIDITNQLSIQK